MVWIRKTIVICVLACLVGACGTGEDTSNASTAVLAVAPTAQSGPTCEQQVATLGIQLTDLRRAQAAMDADPLTARKGAFSSLDTVVAITEPTAISPVPKTFVIEVTAERIHVQGESLKPYRDRLETQLSRLSPRFDKLVCRGDKATAREIALVIHPDVPWQVVQRIIQAVDDAGAARLLLGFTTSSGVVAPTEAALAQVATIEPAVAFAACPAAVAALADPTAAGQLEAALLACNCKVRPDQVGAFVYAESGLVERADRLPVALGFSFVDPQAKPEAKRIAISVAPDVPWSEAHKPVVDAIRSGGALIASLEGAKIDHKRLAVQATRGDEYCQATSSARALRAIEVFQGKEFTRLTGTGDFSSGLDDARVFGGLLDDDVTEMEGGFGFGKSGFGPGGGGPGWGTIGDGTIGHGSGTDSSNDVGSGSGGMRGRKATRPQVRIGKATVKGGMDKNVVRRYIRRKLPRILYCYEKQLLVRHGIKGTVTSTFAISPQGAAQGSVAKGVHPEVSSCIAGVVKTIRFPKPKDGGKVKVSYSFTFKPTGG